MVNPLQEPALATPPGVVSQFPTTHSNEQAWYYVGAVLAAFVPGSLLLLRLYTKVYVVRKVDVTDCMIPTSIYCRLDSDQDIDLTTSSFVSHIDSKMVQAF